MKRSSVFFIFGLLFLLVSAMPALAGWIDPCNEADIHDYIFTTAIEQLRDELGVKPGQAYRNLSYVLNGRTATVSLTIIYWNGEGYDVGEPWSGDVDVLDCYFQGTVETEHTGPAIVKAWHQDSVELIPYKMNSNTFDGQPITVQWLDGADEWHTTLNSFVGFEGDLSFTRPTGDYKPDTSLDLYAIENGQTFTPSGVYRVLLNEQTLIIVAVGEDEIGGVPQVFVIEANKDLVTPRLDTSIVTAKRVE